MKLKKSSKTTQTFLVNKFSKGVPSATEIEVVVEKPFQILINEQVVATIMATPQYLEEFLMGFIVGQGIAKAFQIEKTLIDEEKGLLWAQVKEPRKVDLTKSVITSGCSGGINLDNLDDLEPLPDTKPPDPSVLSAFMKEMLVNSTIYSRAGGVHSACLADNSGIIFMVEDIGRHNCIDKIIGYLANNRIDCQGKFILTTGRLSMEAVSKTVRVKIGTIGSRSSPTNLAIKLAGKLNLNLIGYIKAGNHIRYSP